MIILTADSWGVCEFTVDKDFKGILSNYGLCDLFVYQSDNNGVVNLSTGGGSNSLQLQNLTTFLSKYTPEYNDEFYFVVTDPGRCIDIQKLINSNNIALEIQKLLNSFLDKLNLLAQKYNIVVNLIGGLCDLDDIGEYSNLRIIVPSWGRLCISDYPANIYCNGSIYLLGDLVDNHQLKQQWLDLMELGHRKSHAMEQHPEFFQVEHPTALACRKLRDYIMPRNHGAF